MTTTLAVLSHVNCKTNNNVLRIPDMSCLRFPWYVEMWFEPLVTFPLTLALTSIAAIGTAFTYHKRAENKKLFWSLSAVTVVGAGITTWTFVDYVASSKRYR